MSTIEDFENAPVGATATAPDGSIAFKTGGHGFEWAMYDSHGNLCDNLRNADMVGFTLDPAVPTTAREALDLAWNLAHPVKEEQVIPKGTRYLEITRSGLRERTASGDRKITPELATFRTHEPLPEPEPDWLDAPAVIAVCNNVMDRSVFVRHGDNWWVSENYAAGTRDLRDVTPLYPKGDKQ